MEKIEDNISDASIGNPNNRYLMKNITINSISDINNFCNTYNHNNGYNGIGLGTTLLINDGTYNKRWVVVGFDLESNRTTSQNSTIDNGYGIHLFSKTPVMTSVKFHSSSTNSPMVSYKNSDIRSQANNIGIHLKNTILGNHIINKNVLISSARDFDGPTSYTRSTGYAELPTCSNFGLSGAIYDDSGESNYKFPVLNHKSLTSITGGNVIYTRNLAECTQSWRPDDPIIEQCHVLYGSIINSFSYTTSGFDMSLSILIR